MNKLILTCFLALLVVFANARKPINYEHKKIRKEIIKQWNLENPELLEIDLPDSMIKNHQLLGKYFKVIDNNYVDNYFYIFIGRVNSCRADGCSVSMDPTEDFNTEYFDYFILFENECTVEKVTVFNYAATHGHEVSSKGWLKQFAGYDGTDTLEVGKNVDAISGATISVYGITLDVQMKTEILQNLQKSLSLTSQP